VTALGVFEATQSSVNLAASALTGAHGTLVSPRIAFQYPVVWSVASSVLLFSISKAV